MMSPSMGDGTAVRPAGVVEAAVLAALQQLCFPEDPWSEESVATLVGQPGCFALLAVRGEDPIGFVMARVAAEDAEILAIGVRADTRGLGLGARLLGAALDGAQRLGATAMFLEVAEDNAAARALYKASGFLPVGRRPGYYKRSDGRIAALVLRYSFASV